MTDAPVVEPEEMPDADRPLQEKDDRLADWVSLLNCVDFEFDRLPSANWFRQAPGITRWLLAIR